MEEHSEDGKGAEVKLTQDPEGMMRCLIPSYGRCQAMARRQTRSEHVLWKPEERMMTDRKS